MSGTSGIEALETEHETTFCTDYRAFLQETDTVSLGAAPKTGKGRTWVSDVAEVFTLDALKRELSDLGTWEPALLPHAYPVARTYGGDVFVQVTSGMHEGAILFINHETYVGDMLVTFMLSDAQHAFLKSNAKVFKKLKFAPQSLSTDQLVGFLIDERSDYGALISPSFAEFRATLEKERALTTTKRAVERAPSLVFQNIVKKAPTATSIACVGEELILSGPEGIWRGRPDALKQVYGQPVGGVAASATELWCYQSESVARSLDGGASFETIELPGCMDVTGIALHHGELWASGMVGLWHVKEGVAAEVKTDAVLPIVLDASRLGVLVGTGLSMCLASGGKVTTTTLETPQHKGVRRATVSAMGTLLALDEACTLYRSADSGATWAKSMRPRIKAAASSHFSALVPVGSALLAIADLVMTSMGDGKSFTAVASKLPPIRASVSTGDKAYLVGTDDSLWEVSMAT